MLPRGSRIFDPYRSKITPNGAATKQCKKPNIETIHEISIPLSSAS
jgi:hypothetical protein